MKTAIEITDLSVHFGTLAALDGINLSVDENTFVSILGPNGGGKTTLLKSILGLQPITEGSIRIFGKTIKDLPADDIGYVPQIKSMDRTFPAKPVELVATGFLKKWPAKLKEADRQKAIEAMEAAGVAKLADRSISKLSGGELQRVYLARSIVRRPKLLILDEPNSGVDRKGEKDFNDLLDSYKKKTKLTVMMVTHDWEAAYHHSEKVLLLNHEVICYNKPSEAFKEDNLRRAFAHSGHDHEMMFGVRL